MSIHNESYVNCALCAIGSGQADFLVDSSFERRVREASGDRGVDAGAILGIAMLAGPTESRCR